jgi:hypothetical protein
MNAAILHSPKTNNVDYLESKTNKPVLVKSLQSSVTNNEQNVAKNETQTYSFVGIAG